MKDQLISFETAELAKEKGFTIHKRASFAGDSEYLCEREVYPTQTRLHKWLRDVHFMFVTPTVEHIGSDEWVWSYKLEWLPDKKQNAKRRCVEFMTLNSYIEEYGTYTGAWDTYEEALEYGTQEALKLIKP